MSTAVAVREHSRSSNAFPSPDGTIQRRSRSTDRAPPWDISVTRYTLPRSKPPSRTHRAGLFCGYELVVASCRITSL